MGIKRKILVKFSVYTLLLGLGVGGVGIYGLLTGIPTAAIWTITSFLMGASSCFFAWVPILESRQDSNLRPPDGASPLKPSESKKIKFWIKREGEEITGGVIGDVSDEQLGETARALFSEESKPSKSDPSISGKQPEHLTASQEESGINSALPPSDFLQSEQTELIEIRPEDLDQ